QPLEGGLGLVIRVDAVGANEKKQIWGLYIVACGSGGGTKPCELPFDLRADFGPAGPGEREGQALGVKDERVGGALHIDRPAALAAPAAVRDQRIRMPVAAAEALQLLQGLFEEC